MGMTLPSSRAAVVAYKNASHWGVVLLDRAAQRWNEVRGGLEPSSSEFALYGSDNENVVGRLGGKSGEFTTFSLR
jgi:hypothetical protein